MQLVQSGGCLLWLVSRSAGLCVLLVPGGLALQTKPCDAGLAAYPSDPFQLVSFTPGPLAGGEYEQNDQEIPEFVPLNVVAFDTDTLRHTCKGLDESHEAEACIFNDYAFNGILDVDWMIVGEPIGSFRNHLGEDVAAIESSDTVAWVPPVDFKPGDPTRGDLIEARIKSRADDPATDDGELVLTFIVEVTRGSDCLYDVKAWCAEEGAGGGGNPPPPCEGDPECCWPDDLSGGLQVATGIEVLDVLYPEYGMLANEVRPVTVYATDIDAIRATCHDVPLDPNCENFLEKGFADALYYKWELEGDGRFLVYSTDDKHAVGQTVLVQADYTFPNIPEPIRLTCEIIDDCEPGIGNCIPKLDIQNDPDATLPIELFPGGELVIQVYDLRFINGLNTPRQWTLDEPGGDGPNLAISRCVTTDGITAGDAPFDSSLEPDQDIETFKVQAASLRDDDTAKFKIERISVDETNAYAQESLGVKDPQATGPRARWRSRQELRLVSNAQPTPDVPGAVYDDEVLGAQTIKALLGDRIKATLSVCSPDWGNDFAEVGSVSLPVGLPPCSFNSIQDRTVTGKIAFKRLQLPGLPTPALDVELAVSRLMEDHAQVRTRFECVSADTVAPIETNALTVTRDQVALVNFSVQGTVNWIDGGQPFERAVYLSVPAGSDYDYVADGIEAQIGAGGGPPIYRATHGDGKEELLVVNPGEPDTHVSFWMFGGFGQPTGIVVDELDIDYNGHGSEIELHVLAANHADGDDGTIDCFVFPKHVSQDFIPLGKSFGIGASHTESTSEAAAPVALNTIYIAELAVDADDPPFGMVFGHEMCHVTSDIPSHDASMQSLMYREAWKEPEQVTSPKRILPLSTRYSAIWHASVTDISGINMLELTWWDGIINMR